MIQTASAFWIMWVNCADFAKGVVTPKLFFEIGEPVCFYGGDFLEENPTILLKNNLTKKDRFLTVSAFDGRVSSIDGYYFTDLEEGRYVYVASCADVKGCMNNDGNYSCLPSDKTCKLVQFKGSGENCIYDKSKIDNDTDDDGWSDSCDSFPNDPLERTDFDLDGVGNDNDVSDFNRNIKEMKFPNRGKPSKDNDSVPGKPTLGNGSGSSGNLTGEESEGTGNGLGNGSSGNVTGGSGSSGSGLGNGSSSGSGSSGRGSRASVDSGSGLGNGSTSGFGSSGSGSGTNPIFPGRECTPEYECDYWSECVNSTQTRACIIKNGCTIEKYPPPLEQSCESRIAEQITNLPVPQPSSNQGFAAITGAQIKRLVKPNNLEVIPIAFIIIICALLALSYRKFKRKTSKSF